MSRLLQRTLARLRRWRDAQRAAGLMRQHSQLSATCAFMRSQIEQDELDLQSYEWRRRLVAHQIAALEVDADLCACVDAIPSRWPA